MRKVKMVLGMLIGVAFLYASNADIVKRTPLTKSSPVSPKGKKVILFQQGTAPGGHILGDSLLFDQAATGYYNFYSCQWDSVYPFWSRIADNFTVPYDAIVDSIVWWGGYWNGTPTPPLDFWIEIYEDSSGMPKQNPIYQQRVSFTETNLGDYYQYEAAIPDFNATAGNTYWIVFMPTLVYPPQWGVNGSWPGNTPGWGDGQEAYFKSDFFGYPTWTPATTVWGDPIEASFQIYGMPLSDSVVWDFETGWQGWTHTSSDSFPNAWGIASSNLHSGWQPPNPGDSCLWFDDDAAGSGAPSLQDTALSPILIPTANTHWLKWGVTYNYLGGSEYLEIGIRYYDGTNWNVVPLKTYTSDVSGMTDSADVSAYAGYQFIQIYAYYDDGGGWMWYGAIDNVFINAIIYVPSHDVGVSAILSPTGNIQPNNPVDVIVQVKNYGSNTETFPVHVEIIDPNATVVFTGDSNVTVDADSTLDINFGSWTPSDFGVHTVTAWTALTGDANPTNDTLSQQVNVSAWTSWTPYTGPSINFDRLTHATVYDFDNDKIYMIGGTPDGTAGSNVSYNYRYDPTTDTWETNLANMPTARGWIQGAYWNGFIYVAGGYSNSQTALNVFEAYDIANDQWVTLPNLPQARLAHGTVAWNGNIYVIGGVDASLSSGTQTVFRYDIANATWSQATQLPQQFDMGGVTILGDTIWIVSGYNRAASAAWTDLYAGVIDPTNPDNITWIDMGPLPYPNLLAAACGLRNKIFMIGGFENASTATNKAWEYDIPTGTWSQLPDYVVPIVRNHFAVTRPSDGTVGERIYVVAGDANGDWSPPNNYYYYLEGEIPVAEKPYSAKPILFSINPTLTKGPITVIFTLKKKSNVEISIYNTLGQKVATIFKGIKERGTHTISWNGKLNSGIYFIKVNSPEHYPIKKVIRVK